MSKQCIVPECNNKVKALGLCNKHWIRQWRYGSTSIVKGTGSKKSLISIPWVHRGYRYYWLNGKSIPEHRLLMEKKLGRKLHVDEVVHHIDGDTLNNNIDNLELIQRDAHTSKHLKKIFKCSVCGKLNNGKFSNGMCGRHAQQYRKGKLIWPL